MRLKLKENPSEWRNLILICCAVALVGTVVATWRGWIGETTRVIACVLITVAGLVAIWRPRTFRWFYRAAMTVSFAIGQVIGKVILGAVYLLVVTPLGIALRLAGKDPLGRKSRAESYWKDARRSGNLDQQF